ncbi:sialate O-acetylesterase [Alteromonas sp. ZYF713]|nr:sialate O-acetylesterase [Alteromonas sp. ZYF713]
MIRLLLLCTCLIAQSAGAATTLQRLISDNAVLQRNKPVPLTGTTDSKAPVQIFFNGQLLGETNATNGKWQFELPAQPAGGPHQLIIKSSDTLTVNDLYFGDVWLTSGQSNMELTMARVEEAYPLDVAEANFPLIREFTVPDTYRFDGQNSDYSGGQWRSATQQNIRQLSAVAYYFARQIHLDQNVPIGIVNASLGGSPIAAWMHKDILAPYPDKIAAGERFADPAVDKQTRNEDKARSDAWYAKLHQADKGLHSTPEWYAPELDDSDWQTITMPDNLPTNGEGFIGVWWLRKTLHLDELPAEPMTLRLGRIVDADTAYINGHEVGGTGYQYPPRRYNVTPDMLKKGTNVIAIRVTSGGGSTGFVQDKAYFLGTDNARYPLAGEWHYKIAAKMPRLAGSTFIRWQPMGLYNAMIAPATRFPLTGALWYQGESNSGAPNDYADKLTAMIKHWRGQWEQPDMPFIIVQLTNFMARQAQPVESNWAVLRDQQRQVGTLDHTASVVTLDVGEWNDIHPVNKATVGERLALAARNIAYGQDIAYQGPAPTKAERKDDKVIVHFSHTGDGLTEASPLKQSFAIAGADNQYFWADVQINNDKVVLSSDMVSQPVHVRYGWADNPDPGLFSSTGLPAAAFSMAVTSATNAD